MSGPIDFYFDFSSPYAYFGAHKIDEMGESFGREVVWRPMMLGAAMKQTGTQPLVAIPVKGDYCLKDWARLARFQELPWNMPTKFPIAALAPTRAFYWISDQNSGRAKQFAWACLSAFFGEGRDISDPETVIDIASTVGVDAEALRAALSDDAVKQRVKDETAAAIENGVFGSPFFIVDGEAFWGADRLWMLKRWLRSGGW
jgi:2-hydroxychromene-2-carboxylate isomerase